MGGPFGRRSFRGLVAAFLLLAGCSQEPPSGPVEITWDRDTCERCAMAIGDRRFAAQVRKARDRRVHRFDDLGCALLWLAEHEGEGIAGSGAEGFEIWVRDTRGESWIDGRAARYAAGHRTPMGYGFAPTASDRAGSLDLAAVQSQLLVRRDERRNPGR